MSSITTPSAFWGGYFANMELNRNAVIIRFFQLFTYFANDRYREALIRSRQAGMGRLHPFIFDLILDFGN